jgi:hypothetical protein
MIIDYKSFAFKPKATLEASNALNVLTSKETSCHVNVITKEPKGLGLIFKKIENIHL